MIRTEEFADPNYLRNNPDRCYFCKSELYGRLSGLLGELGVDVIASGANTDDAGDHRPGMRAAGENGVRHPLQECGLSKADVRALAKAWGLPTWDKPATPCLSSRIAYGEEVTPERVRMIDQAEQWLRRRGLRLLRVRYHKGDLARIEVPLEELPRLAAPEVRDELVAAFRALGFKFVTLDLEGFRSGSLNAVIPLESLPRPARGGRSERGAGRRSIVASLSSSRESPLPLACSPVQTGCPHAPGDLPLRPNAERPRRRARPGRLPEVLGAGSGSAGASPQRAPADGFIRFPCPCGRRLKVRADGPPQAGKCPDCGRIVPVPRLVLDPARSPPTGHPEAPTEELSAADLAMLDEWARAPGQENDTASQPAVEAWPRRPRPRSRPRPASASAPAAASPSTSAPSPAASAARPVPRNDRNLKSQI